MALGSTSQSRSRRLRILAAIGLAIVGAGGALWLQRKTIASDALGRTLAARGVTVSYRVTRIGLRWQRIDRLVIGDPAHPDLTAEWAEVRVVPAWNGVRVTTIRAKGLRLRGRWADGRLRLGDVDKLLPASRGPGVTLPDIDLTLDDGNAEFDTPWGVARFNVDGKGRLSDGFAGKATADLPLANIEGCSAARLTFAGSVGVSRQSPRVVGPVRADLVACRGVRVVEPVVTVDASLTSAVDSWRGKLSLRTPSVQTAAARLDDVEGTADFSGSARHTAGVARLSARGMAIGANRGSGALLAMRFDFGAQKSARGSVAIARVLPDPRLSHVVRNAALRASETPVGPLAVALSRSLDRAFAGARLDGSFSLAIDKKSMMLKAADGRLTGEGAVLSLVNLGPLSLGGGRLEGGLAATLLGAGFPRATTQAYLSGPTVHGIAHVAAFEQGGAKLDLGRVRYARNGRGDWRAESAIRLSGPLELGRVEGLAFPLVLATERGRLLLGQGCTPVSVDRVHVGTIWLDPAGFAVCPSHGSALLRTGRRIEGGGIVRSLMLSGRVGSSPLTARINGARVDLGSDSFSAEGLDFRLGAGERVSRLKIMRLDGRRARSGRFSGASGKIGAVPLVLAGAGGRWRFARGALDLQGALTVSDAAPVPRFNLLAGTAVRLRLADSRIVASGELREPASNARVASVSLRHDLRSGRGDAALGVDGLTFGKALQPEAISPLTLGVVANVVGGVSGQGHIAWSPAGTTSKGTFSTDRLDFAAAFGPVTGLQGTIRFDDLLGLTTPPGQQVTIASINPGTPVLTGLIRYQLLPGQRLAIEDGRWPFSGGTLTLEPTALELGRASERRLTFRVDGLDAAQFVQRFEIDDLAATGIFDGAIPMIFDDRGGRIEDGRLIVREPGGTIAYVGQISQTQMNMFAKLAFDALKSIRYRNLGIDLDGPLDGEMVSQIRFTGVNQREIVPSDGVLVRKFLGLPFRFNITIRAPFRGLLSSVRSLQDPGILLRQVQPLPVPPGVQPPASNDRP